MVMNRNGKSCPANTGPVPSTNRVSAGICRSGRAIRMANREQHHRTDLQEGRQIIPRREQQPHRQNADRRTKP